MSKNCPTISDNNGSSILAQQLFLGASINGFSSNIGWGGSPSSLNIELVNDFGSSGKCFRDNNVVLNIFNIKNTGKYDVDNHYYNCKDNDCYTDENGDDFDPDREETKDRFPSKERRIPGKVYHILDKDGLVSKYWRTHDPGFFGAGTILDPNGNINPRYVTDSGGNRVILPYKYNIIGVPAYFRYGYFTFGGIIKSWDQTISMGPQTFNLTISSADDLLANSYIILDNYAGSIFSSLTSNPIMSIINKIQSNKQDVGSPTNYIGNNVNYTGSLGAGNIPNVFNIYGFLESYGFGVSQKNDQGIPIEFILKALSVLTSSTNKNLGNKAAFSPFGRIIAPIPLTDAIDSRDEYYGVPTNTNFGNYSFGLCDVVNDVNGIPRCEFILDISELPIPPRNIRLDYGGDAISIIDLIRQVCDKTGRDFYTTMIRKNNLNIIKIKTVNRTLPVSTNNVTKIISSLIESGIKTTTSSIGQEYNEATPKVFYIGANQQRLYQTKSYLLGYSQSTFVYHPVLKKFIDLQDINSIKEPSIFSTRNLTLSEQILGKNISDIFSKEQKILGNNPDSKDIDFSDSDVVDGSPTLALGNYLLTQKYNDNEFSKDKNTRYIPLYKNTISPFFGYHYNEKINIDTNEGSNTYRYIRPVYYDSWTNQIVVYFNIDELPVLSAGSLTNIYTIREDQGQPTGDAGGKQRGLNTDPSPDQTSIPPPTGSENVDPSTGQTSASAIKSSKRPDVAFTITETEMRAAMMGWEAYLAYCFAKMNFSKPDLFVMLTDLYLRLGKIFGSPVPPIKLETGGGQLGSRRPVGDANSSGQNGQPTGVATPAYKQLNINFNMFLNHEFIKDLEILVSFINQIANDFYGQKYLVRLPELRAYKDSQNPDIKIPASQGGSVAVFQGSGKIYFNYEISTNGAWEEFGNAIDGEIEIGSPNYYKLIDSNNLIKPLLGYNAGFNKDVVTEKWCELEQKEKQKLLELFVDPESGKEKRRNIIAQLNKFGWNIENCSTKVVPSLDVGSLSDYVLTTVDGKVKDAFGNIVEAPRQKLYLPVNVNSDFAFLDPLNLRGPMAIVDAGNGVDLYLSSHSYVSDPNLTIVSNASAEDLAILEKAEQSSDSVFLDFLKKSIKDYNVNIDKLKDILMASIIPIKITSGDKFVILAEGDTANQSSKHATIARRKAHPTFAAIPLKSNQYCYGPWTNYPSLADQSILFPEIKDSSNLVEQMISNVKIQKNNDFAPWNYGGMAFLDQAVIYDTQNYLSYQTRLEQGSITIGSLPVFGLAGNLTKNITDSAWHRLENDQFLGFSYNYLVYPFNNPNKKNPEYNGITISNISINVNSSNITTTYSFRTYSPKLGIFSKENSDRIKEFTSSISSVNKRIADTSKNLENSIRKQINSIIDNSKKGRISTNTSEYSSKIYDSSPTQLLIGKGSYYIPLETGVISITGMANSWAGMFVPKEAIAELSKEFSSKSVMSMDGLFSPVSFYPTENKSTFPISSRAITSNLKSKDITCPKCNGTGKIKDKIKKSADDEPKEIDFPCPFCAKSRVLPFDYSSTSNVDNAEEDETEPPIINFNTLNPVSLSSGEFRNLNAQSIDGGRHNIRVVGRSDIHPVDNQSLDIFHNINNKDLMLKDFSDIDISYKELFGTKILNNQRFFAHRGPLMLHGWGYDTEGYPVPNAADEPKEINSDGLPKRFFLTSSGTNDLTTDGAFLPEGDKQLGDIIGKGWTQEDGEWQRKPSNKFYLNWGERPDLWPIGPIDLRWDYENKIWVGGGGGGGGCSNADPPYIIASGNNSNILSEFIVAGSNKTKGCSYKMVYGVLEQDLVKLDNHIESSPTRAFLDDLEYGLKPLPENIRRLIYVVDRTGYTAPRGAKILLRYNSETGFYEPVSKQQYTVFGLLNENKTATVELSYMPGYKAGESSYKVTIPFANPLGLNSKNTNSEEPIKGIFMYDNSRWNLISIG